MRLTFISCIMWLGVLLIATPAYADTASGGVTVSGRVYNATTGAGLSGVGLDTCGSGVISTDYNGDWQFEVPAGSVYCVRIYNNLPTGVTGPTTPGNTRIDGNQVTSYENQVAGVDCSQSGVCTSDQQYWDMVTDSGLDFAYTRGAVLGTTTQAQTIHPNATARVIPWFRAHDPHFSPQVWSGIGAIAGLLLIGVIVALWGPLHRHRKQSYADYIRAKYYNL